MTVYDSLYINLKIQGYYYLGNIANNDKIFICLKENMHKLKLFFSWQSDTKDNHKIIGNSLMNACNEIRAEKVYDINYDESTWNRSGSPIIDSTVIEKAKDCDLFVADLTPIETSGTKDLPNPNVMYELGVAKSNLTDESILMLYTGKVEAARMPFDINHHRLSKFSDAHITEYLKLMAEHATKNPRHHSLFDESDKQLFLFSNYNINKNISSGKYLPNVFLENRSIKQHLRDFVAPYPFAKLVLERCDMIDTYHTNRNRKFRGEAPFVFDVTDFESFVAEEEIGTFYKGAKLLENYLVKKNNELFSGRDNYYLRSSKYGKLISHMQHISSKLLLITASAGQGKTNQICDLVYNVLIKRRIPFVFLNGYEIDANDIFSTFASYMLPGTNMSFDEVIKNTVTYCKYRRNPIILIIDGLNENPKPDIFCRNLAVFMEKVLQYDCVKVIMTCRSEYYKEFFTDFDAAFKERMLKMENLNEHHNKDEQRHLIQSYLQYFNIHAEFSEHVEESLCNDLLMLRIFCEANKNKSLGYVYSINKEVVFAEYYEIMKHKLVDKVFNEEHYRLEANLVDNFVMNIVQYMIEKNTVFNAPLSHLQKNLTEQENSIFNRFLDENILLRKDLTPELKGPFSRNEVVNFTYDSFRDYLISTYLLDVVEPNDYTEFEALVREYTRAGHQLREGLTPFLFVHARSSQIDNAIKLISSLDWYEEIFEMYIWDVDDLLITQDDILLVKLILASDQPVYMAKRLIFFGHWNSELYPKLNIRVLLEYLAELNDEDLANFLDRIWPQTTDGYKIYGKKKSERTLFLESIERQLSDTNFTQHKDFHNLYELLLYLVPFSDSLARKIFCEYYNKFIPIDMLKRVEAECNSDKLKSIIHQMKIK